MNKDKQRELASRGGKTAHAQGTAHKFTTEKAKAAGQIGGLKISSDAKHMAEIGRKGGIQRHLNRKAKENAQ